MRDLRLRVAQVAPVRGDVEANVERLEAVARQAGADGVDLLVFPELSLTGYALGEGTRGAALPAEPGKPPPFPLPPGAPVTLVGLVEMAADRRVFNTALLVREGVVLHRHRKIHLPTYGMFDEGRYFGPGREPPRATDPAPGWRTGILVCEDFWHPVLSWLLALQGIDLLLVPAAAPGRLPLPNGSGGLRFASTDRWELLARGTALAHGIWVVVANRAGTEDGTTFAGGSLVVAPSGDVVARAREGEEDEVTVTLARDAVTQARTPYHHLRDEDPAFVLRALDGLLAGEDRAGGTP